MVARGRDWLLPIVLPLVVVVAILVADRMEGPKTAFVGVLSVVPMLAAVFGTPRQTAAVGALTWLAAFGYGLRAEDGASTAQAVRLVVIAVFAVGAVAAAAQRTRRERALNTALLDVAVVGEQAERDPLTGTLNRRGVLAALDVPREQTWTVALVDMDRFKDVNDRHGHLVGDEVVTAVAQRVSRAVSGSDVVGRWGGDEFLLAIPLAPDRAETVLRRVLRRATEEPLRTTAGPLRVGLTMGASAWAPGEDLDVALRRADAALYRGKNLGRNRIVVSAG